MTKTNDKAVKIRRVMRFICLDGARNTSHDTKQSEREIRAIGKGIL